MTTNTRVLILCITVKSGGETRGATWRLERFGNITIISLEISLSLYHLLIIDLINRSDFVQSEWEYFKRSQWIRTFFHVRTRTPSKLRISPENAILNACHVVERKYSKQDFVAIYQAIGGYVFIHSKINILPMTFGMHIAWDRGLILIYLREQKVLNATARYFSFLCYRRPIQFDWLSIVRKCDEHLYDGREVKVGFSPKFDLVEKGIAGFNYCGQTRAHPILLLLHMSS
ncbi:hypothetical protein LENED_009080 [Lentinula edodes]|uniref:Uncharacterized protein n=1 Tax=Lentinula edodes TaxID=5353 RepID=A0A1Q3EIU2_LENED|nr:hypothetical protein LENED_009080 [Lentinula edodes]